MRPMNGAVEAADTLVAAGRHDEAARLYRRALEREPDNARAAMGLIRLMLAAGDLRAAVTVAEAAMSHNPHDVRLLVMQADIGLWRSIARTCGRMRNPGWSAPPSWNHGTRTWRRHISGFDAQITLSRKSSTPNTGRSLRRYSAREGDTYIFVIDIVGTCNLRCPTCPVGNSPERPRGFMDLALFRRIIAKIRRESPVPHPQINLYNWGEPLLHPELPRIIAILRQAGMRSYLSSNLNIKRGLEAVIAAGPDELKISLSGFSQETYSRTHARGEHGTRSDQHAPGSRLCQ